MELLNPEQIENLSDEKLIITHGQLHSYFQRMLNGEKFNRESLVNSHLFILDELQRRDLKHKVSDELDEETMRLNKINISLPANDNGEEELLMSALSDDTFIKAMTSPSEWSTEEFAVQSRGMPGIYLTPPHGRLIAEGKKTLIVKSIKFTKYTGTPIIVVSGKKAYGEIVLKPPIEINLDEFDDLRDKHRITEDERNRWWASKQKLYAYDFTVQKIYDSPIKVDIPRGAQTFFRSVEIRKRISPLLQSSLDKLQDIVIIPDFISISGRTVINEPSNDIDFIWRAKFDENDQLILQLREFLMKFTRSFPGELQKEFHHVDNASGAAWHFKPIADLVLRFKDKPIVELENDSYAYYKPIKKQADDTILFRVIGRMRKSQRFETLNLEEPKKVLEGDEALKLYQRLNKASQVWVLRCAIRDGRTPVTIDLQKFVKESDLVVRWNADIAHPEWQGLDDPQLWEMLEGYEHRAVGQHAYWSTFSKLFDSPPPLGSIIAIRPAKLLRFIGKEDKAVHYTWLWPSIIQIMSTEEMPDNISNLDARHLIDEESEIMKPVKKEEEKIACWVACFPKEKGWLNELQECLGLPINDQSGSSSLHLTLAVFNSFEDVEKIGAIIAKANIEKFVFEPVILDAFGDETQVVVLRGSTSEKILALANELRTPESAIVDHDFSPHITLGETDKAENLVQDFAGVQIEFGAPVFMVSIPDKIEKRHSLSRCMRCEKPPEYDVLWGNGKAHAWFCGKHFWDWQKSEHDLKNWSDINAVKMVKDDKATEKWSDNHNPNILDHLKFGIAGYTKIKEDDFKIKLMEPFVPVKSQAGYRLYEFQVGQENELWETWARGYIEKKDGENNG